MHKIDFSSFRMSSGLISPDDYYASRVNNGNSSWSNQKSEWPQGYAKGPGRFQSGAARGYNNGHQSDGVKKEEKKGNAFLHLENFTSVQQLALFEPSIEIITQQLKPNRLLWFLNGLDL